MRLVIACLVLLMSTSALGTEKRNPYLRLLERTQRLKAAFSKSRNLFNQQSLRIPALVHTLDPGLTCAAVRLAGGHAGRPIGDIHRHRGQGENHEICEIERCIGNDQ